MYSPTVIGVDPGVVHTGVVMFDFDLEKRELVVAHRVVDGTDAAATRDAISDMTNTRGRFDTLDIFIEEYRPRSGFGVDQQMMVANAEFRTALKGKLLRNMGVKKVVTRELLEMLNVYRFSTTTHHQDLRSAARIAILGMLLDPALNNVLYLFTTDTLDGRTWNVRAN
jgi:hypothetical protein